MYVWEQLEEIVRMVTGLNAYKHRLQEMAEPEIIASQRSFRDAEAIWQIRSVQAPPCPASRKQEPVDSILAW